MVIGRARIAIAPPGAVTVCEVGDEPIVSLVPLGGPAHGVITRGLRWELNGETLAPLASRGVSNVPLSQTFSVSLDDGRIAVIQPYHFSTRTSTGPLEGDAQ